MIRPATIHDLVSIVEIYNQAIDAKFQTGFTQRFDPAQRVDWLNDHIDTSYPLFVHTHGTAITGWISISPYRQGRGALKYSVEISYFIHKDYQQKGIGSLLLSHALDACRQLGYRVIIAIVLDKNTGSTMLLHKFGFRLWGSLPGVADFDGFTCGHLYYGKNLLE